MVVVTSPQPLHGIRNFEKIRAMKFDNDMKRAVFNISRLRYADVNSEAQAIARFCADVLLPILNEQKNSKAYKEARSSLVIRGINASLTLESEKEL